MKKLPEYQVVDIDTLVPYEKNPRFHPEKQIKQLVESIKKFGFLVPIVVGKNSVIAAGHGRFEAAKEMGLKQVPIVDAKHLTAAQRRAYAIADNKISSNSEEDSDLMKIELSELHALDIDLTNLGFEIEELAKFVPEIDIPDLDIVDDPTQKANFIIVCDDLEELHTFMAKLSVTKPKMSLEEFREVLTSEDFNP